MLNAISKYCFHLLDKEKGEFFTLLKNRVGEIEKQRFQMGYPCSPGWSQAAGSTSPPTPCFQIAGSRGVDHT